VWRIVRESKADGRPWPSRAHGRGDRQNGEIRAHFIVLKATTRPRTRLVQEKTARLDRFWWAIRVQGRCRSKPPGSSVEDVGYI
jgi:hypothetical protein